MTFIKVIMRIKNKFSVLNHGRFNIITFPNAKIVNWKEMRGKDFRNAQWKLKKSMSEKGISRRFFCALLRPGLIKVRYRRYEQGE